MNDQFVVAVQNGRDVILSVIFTIRTDSIGTLENLRYVYNRYCLGMNWGNPKAIADLQIYAINHSSRLGAGVFKTRELWRAQEMFRLDDIGTPSVAHGLANGAVAVSKGGVYEMIALTSNHMTLFADTGVVYNSSPKWLLERERPEQGNLVDFPFSPWRFNISRIDDMIRFCTENGNYYKYKGGYIVLQ